MGKFIFYLDRRGKKNKPDDYKYPLVIRANIKNDTRYLQIPNDLNSNGIIRLTNSQFNRVFTKNTLDEKSIEFREKCRTHIVRCEKILSTLGGDYTIGKFVESYNSEGDITTDRSFNSLVLTEIYNHYIKSDPECSVKHKSHLRTSVNVFNTFYPGITLLDITPLFLERLKSSKEGNVSPATIQSYNRDIRKLINYAGNVLKLLPKGYKYPYGKGGFTIGSYFPSKIVMSKQEIKNVVDCKNFDSPEQEYARDIWLFLYRCNGINFIDLLNLKWDNIKGEFIVFYRWKTRRTRKNNIKPIQCDITKGIKYLLDKIGDKSSPYILGKLKEGSSEITITNKCKKLKKFYNNHLIDLSKKLNLSVPLLTQTARDCYATTLFRNRVSKEEIGEMLGHSNSIVTEHYLAGLDIEKVKRINRHIL